MSAEIKPTGLATKLEKLYIITALERAVANVKHELRRECDDAILADFKRDGIKSRDARLVEEKVGTYTVTVKPGKTYVNTMITSTPDFAAWVADNPELCTQFAMAHSVEFAQFVLDETGELPCGCDIAEVSREATYTPTLKIDLNKVVQALGAQLPSAIADVLQLPEGGM